jgi:8-oxo-dGTP diphosphatase
MIDVVCGVIEDSSGRFLACLRPEGKHLGGLWEFPGGKVDPGESPESALARELREELDIEVKVGAALDPVLWCYDQANIRLLPFRCSITAGHPQPLEHERLHWCAPEDFDALAWAAADLPILVQIRNGITRSRKTSS